MKSKTAENAQPASLDGCLRCPQCHQAPAMTIQASLDVELACPRHGHTALGSSLEQAVQHWNIYVRWITKQDAVTAIRQKGAI